MNVPISGFTFLHNGVEFDYCFEAAIRSISPVCEDIVVVDAASTDSTRDRLEALKSELPQLHIVETSWNPAPLDQVTNTDWTMDLANFARQATLHPFTLYIQGDEVLDSKSFDEVRACAARGLPFFVNRLNFWRDQWSLAPRGRVCGDWVCRLAPREFNVAWGSEGFDDQLNGQPSNINLFHYGFLRDAKAFRKKAEIMSKNFMGSVDPIVYEAERHGIQHFRHAWPESELKPFKGQHPQVAWGWLKQHGFAPL